MILVLVCAASLANGCASLLGIEELDGCKDNSACVNHGEGWICDVERHACIPPPGAECTSDAQCLLDIEPICGDEQTCRSCESSQECRDKNADTPICSPSGACTSEEPPACVDSDDCTDSPTAPICDQVAGECKSCKDVADQTACAMRGDGSAPYCAPDGTCAVCFENAHCDTSGVCGENGSCVPESEVVYVKKVGSSDANDCSRVAPCLSLTRARDAVLADNVNKRFIRILDGENYLGNFSLTGINVSIIGSGNTQIIAIEDNRPAVDITSKANVTLANLSIMSTGIDALGVRCQSADSSLRLVNAIVRENAKLGIEVIGCRLEIERSIITANAGGGIDIRDAAFSIANSFIVGNGSDNGAPTPSDFGGVRIVNVDPYEPQFFAFNTIAENRAGSGAGGVQCSVNPASTVTATSSIVRRGDGSSSTLVGDCVWRNSNIEDGDTLGDIAAMANGNNYADCGLTADGAGIFRITGGSPCDNAGQTDTGIDDDYEGQARPATPGVPPDMGADELHDGAE